MRGVFSQNTTLEVMASKTWKKLKFASKFGNKAEIVREKEEEVEEDLLYKIVKEPEPKYKNIIRDYSQIMMIRQLCSGWPLGLQLLAPVAPVQTNFIEFN